VAEGLGVVETVVDADVVDVDVVVELEELEDTAAAPYW
jgi:hypothetical protein